MFRNLYEGKKSKLGRLSYATRFFDVSKRLHTHEPKFIKITLFKNLMFQI